MSQRERVADQALGEAANRATQDPDELEIATLVGRARRTAPDHVARDLRAAREFDGLDDNESVAQFRLLCAEAREQLQSHETEGHDG